MEKRKIDAKQILAEIRAGLSDPELMEKYSLTIQGLNALFRKLVDAALLNQEELDNRVPLSQRSLSFNVFRCPACGMPQLEEFSICPQCGVIVSKFVDQKRPTKNSTRSASGPNQGLRSGSRPGSRAGSASGSDVVHVPLDLPKELHRKLSTLGGRTQGLIIEAIEEYVKRRM